MALPNSDTQRYKDFHANVNVWIMMRLGLHAEDRINRQWAEATRGAR